MKTTYPWMKPPPRLRRKKLEGRADLEDFPYLRGEKELYTSPEWVKLVLDRTLSAHIQSEAQRESLLAENKRQRELLEQIFETSPVGLAVVSGPELRYQMFNPAYRAVVPYPNRLAVGRAFAESSPPEEGYQGHELVEQVIATRQMIVSDHVRRAYPNNEERYVSFRVLPIDWNGQAAALLVLWDTTELEVTYRQLEEALEDTQQAEQLMRQQAIQLERELAERTIIENALARSNQALRASERRVRAILDTITDSYFLLDANWRYVDINENALRYLEKTREDLIGRSIWDVYPASKDIYVGQNYRKAVETGQPVRFELESITVPRWADVHVYPTEDGLAIYFTDITERKQNEQRTRFLATLGDRLINLMEPGDIFRLVSEEVGRFFKAEVCWLGDVDLHKNQVVVQAGYHHSQGHFRYSSSLDDHPPVLLAALKRGETVIVEDTRLDARAAAHRETIYHDTGAFLAIPRMRDQVWVGSLTISFAQPRQWTPEELEFLATVADLSWLAVENARAYQNHKQAEERFRVTLSNAPVIVFTMDAAMRYTWIYNGQNGNTDLFLGKRDDELEVLDGESARELMAFKQSILERGVGDRREITLKIIGEEQYFIITAEPTFDPAGQVNGLTGAALNITQQRRLEALHLESIARTEVQHRLLEQREMERQQIARDLHDGPIQNLVGLIFSMQSAQMLAEQPEVKQAIAQLQSEAQALVSELRGVCNELRPPVLVQFGLRRALRSHAQEFALRHSGVKIDLKLSNHPRMLPDDVCLTLYRIYQEGLNNILKHSQATRVRVDLDIRDNEVALTLQDNGKGFAIPFDWVDLARHGHLGLVGMKERAEAVGGRLLVSSQLHQGTRIQAVIPCREGE